MEPIRVMVVEFEGPTHAKLAEYMRKQSDISLVGTARDGIEALRRLSEDIPDVLITELVLPQMDGLGLLEQLSTFPRRPDTIVLSNMQNDMVIGRAVELGVSYYMCKPCDFRLLHQRTRQCYNYAKRMRLDDRATPRKIEDVLREQGIPSGQRGYAFLTSAIRISLKNGGMPTQITKDIYPVVAQSHNTSPENVERAMRHVISAAWDKRHETNSPILQSAKKPSNGEYLARMVRHMQEYRFS